MRAGFKKCRGVDGTSMCKRCTNNHKGALPEYRKNAYIKKKLSRVWYRCAQEVFDKKLKNQTGNERNEIKCLHTSGAAQAKLI